MNHLPLYLFYIIYLKLYFFLRRWYFNSFRLLALTLRHLIKKLDRFFALSLSLSHLLTPLYQDYSLIGFLISFPVRLTLLLTGTVTYLILTLIFISVYLIWALFPIFLLIKIISPELIPFL